MFCTGSTLCSLKSPFSFFLFYIWYAVSEINIFLYLITFICYKEHFKNLLNLKIPKNLSSAASLGKPSRSRVVQGPGKLWSKGMVPESHFNQQALEKYILNCIKNCIGPGAAGSQLAQVVSPNPPQFLLCEFCVAKRSLFKQAGKYICTS